MLTDNLQYILDSELDKALAISFAALSKATRSYCGLQVGCGHKNLSIGEYITCVQHDTCQQLSMTKKYTNMFLLNKY